jgi:hypothetical protein
MRITVAAGFVIAVNHFKHASDLKINKLMDATDPQKVKSNMRG